tara:strand:+ start:10350 stop:10487 length:138 start_codon:yes stop_codon:yes gene_type:complete
MNEIKIIKVLHCSSFQISKIMNAEFTYAHLINTSYKTKGPETKTG